MTIFSLKFWGEQQL